MRKAKAHLELNLAKDVKANNKGFFKYITTKINAWENVVLLLLQSGDWGGDLEEGSFLWLGRLGRDHVIKLCIHRPWWDAPTSAERSAGTIVRQERCLRAGRKQMSPQSLIRAKGGPRELLDSQPHFNPWKGDRTAHSGGHLHSHGRQHDDQERSAWIH